MVPAPTVPAPASGSAASGTSASGPHAHISAAPGEDAATFHALDRKLAAAAVDYTVSTHDAVQTSEQVRVTLAVTGCDWL